MNTIRGSSNKVVLGGEHYQGQQQQGHSGRWTPSGAAATKLFWEVNTIRGSSNSHSGRWTLLRAAATRSYWEVNTIRDKVNLGGEHYSVSGPVATTLIWGWTLPGGWGNKVCPGGECYRELQQQSIQEVNSRTQSEAAATWSTYEVSTETSNTAATVNLNSEHTIWNSCNSQSGTEYSRTEGGAVSGVGELYTQNSQPSPLGITQSNSKETLEKTKDETGKLGQWIQFWLKMFEVQGAT